MACGVLGAQCIETMVYDGDANERNAAGSVKASRHARRRYGRNKILDLEACARRRLEIARVWHRRVTLRATIGIIIIGETDLSYKRQESVNAAVDAH